MNFIDCVIAKENGGIYARSPGMNIRIPEDKMGLLDSLIDKEAVMGLRPEDINVLDASSDPKHENTFQSKVWVVEPLGSEQLVYLRGESGTLIARFDPQVVARPGDEIELSVDMEKGHIFDKETEEAIF